MPGQPADDLNAIVADAEANPTAWEFFALVRAVENANVERPRVGTALDPAQEAIDLAHFPSADFPASTIASLTRTKRRPVARSQHLGLTGPMGPMPQYLTDIAVHENRLRGPTPFNDFLDLVSARMLQAFYRAWAEAQPCAQADRPADDRFAARLGAASGAVDLRFVTAAERPAYSEDGFDDWRRLAYGGHLAGLKSASAIADLLSHLLEREVSVGECVGRWRTTPADARTALGRQHNTLGLGATLGGSYFAVEWDVALSVRARSMQDLNDFLPGGHAHRLLTEAATSVLPAHLDWTARIEIDERQITPAQLGMMRLGHTGWIGPRGRSTMRSDLRLSGQRPRQAA